MDVLQGEGKSLYRLANETKSIAADDYRRDVNLSSVVGRVASRPSV